MYTFRDRKGGLYYGPPGEAYGVLTPIYHSLEKERPNAFASDNGRYNAHPFTHLSVLTLIRRRTTADTRRKLERTGLVSRLPTLEPHHFPHKF